MVGFRVSLVLLGGMACAPPTHLERQDQPVLPLSASGAFLKDAAGRSLLLRGFNYSGLEYGNFVGSPTGPRSSDFEQLQSWGSTVVRLAFAWSYLEPEPGQIQTDYLEQNLDPVLDWARANGQMVILEMHQWYWSPCTGGLGMPDWVCDVKPYPATAQGAFAAQHDFWNGALAPDGESLLEHWFGAWEAVVERYRGHSAVVGFNFLNEPQDLENAGSFEEGALYPAYQHLTQMLRAKGALQLAVIEPPVVRNIGYPVQPQPMSDSNVLYAPHLYTTTSGLPELLYTGTPDIVAADYAAAQAEADQAKALLWVGEYGGVTRAEGGFAAATALGIRHALDEQDRRQLGGALWAYFPGGNEFSVVDENRLASEVVLEAWVRPTAWLVAGIPTSMSYDMATRVYRLQYEDAAGQAPVPNPTRIKLPKSRLYPQDFDVRLSKGDRWEWNPEEQTVDVVRSLQNREHFVEILPR